MLNERAMEGVLAEVRDGVEICVGVDRASAEGLHKRGRYAHWSI